MTDRELLELAAKAAGVKFDKPSRNGAPDRSGFDLIGNAVLDWHDGKTWNPLTDDGDALRLYVKLNMLHGKVFARSVSDNHEDGDDIYAATRRAIVRAAAEIGKAMG
jgi:hypothetical protein